MTDFPSIAGWVGSAMLMICSVPQAYLSVKQGHSEGISPSMLWLWIGGMALSMVYMVSLNATPALISHVANTIMAGIIAWYYYFPRRLNK